MTQPHAARTSDRLVQVGAVVFALGTAAVVVTVAPLLLGWHRLPVAAYLLCMLAPLGLGVALLGLYAEARSRRRPRD